MGMKTPAGIQLKDKVANFWVVRYEPAYRIAGSYMTLKAAERRVAAMNAPKSYSIIVNPYIKNLVP